MSKIIVLCPAKINLFLNIVGQSGNMHLLNMVNQTVDLYDYITIETNNTGKINITCNNDGIPLNQENTCFKAALSMKANFGILPPLETKVKKKQRKEAYANRAIETMTEFLREHDHG